MRKLLYVLAGTLLVLFLGFQAFKQPIAKVLFERAVANNIGRSAIDNLPDGLHVFMCGAGSPMPDATRGGPCIGVVAGNTVLVIDAGSGGVRTLAQMRFPIGEINSVYLTHLHSDHIDGLGELMLQAWINGPRTTPLPVYGPVGTANVVAGFNQAYQIDAGYRTAHHGERIAPPTGFGTFPVELSPDDETLSHWIVFKQGDLKITAIKMAHAPVAPAFGYRIDYKGRSVSISGDTIFHPAFNEASKGVDVMFHEALQPKMVASMGKALAEKGRENIAAIMQDILDYHTSPEDAAKAATAAQAKQLILYHIVPPLPLPLLQSIFLGDAATHFDGPIEIATDGLMISLPAGNNKVILKNTL